MSIMGLLGRLSLTWRPGEALSKRGDKWEAAARLQRSAEPLPLFSFFGAGAGGRMWFQCMLGFNSGP